jgi:hypothetical protein
MWLDSMPYLSILRLALLVLLMGRVASAQITNGSFETGDFTGWTEDGVPYVSNPAVTTLPSFQSPALPSPISGSYQALLNTTGNGLTSDSLYYHIFGAGPVNSGDPNNSDTAANLEAFLGSITLPSNGPPPPATPYAPFDGQAISQTFSVSQSSTLTFSYAYQSREAIQNQYDETGYVLNGVFHVLADTNTPGQTAAVVDGNGSFFTHGIPYQTVTVPVSMGQNTISFVVYNTSNGSAPTGIFLDNILTTAAQPITYTPLSTAQPTAVSGSAVAGSYIDPLGAQRAFYFNDGSFAQIGPGDSLASQSNGISGSIVVGWYTDSGGVNHGFAYDATTKTPTTVTTIDPPGGVSTGTYATAVSGSDIVGWYQGTDGNQHGFSYDGTNPVTTLDMPLSFNATGTVITGIDSLGNVVGWYKDTNGIHHGFLYNGTTFTELDPGSVGSEATGIDNGNAVGWYLNGSARDGFLYNGTTTTTIHVPNSTATQPTGVSGANVVGFYTDANNVQHGFLSNGGAYISTIDPAGSTSTQVTAVSGLNVVGVSSDTAYPTHGFLAATTNTPTAAVNLGSLAQTYDGTPKAATATTTPAGLSVSFTYNGSATPPTAAGTYSVVATVNDPNYQGIASGTLQIAKATAPIALGSLSATYDGTPKAATATTTPANLNVTFAYGAGASSTQPTNAGSYAVTATINDPNYQGTATDTLVVAQATATITLGNLSATYDGTPKSATATTSPAGLSVSLTYNPNPPTNVGSYDVEAAITDPNYTGTASGTLVISSASGTQSYSDWATAHNVTGAPTDTPENDGVPNLLKYYFDINPSAPMSSNDRDALPKLGSTVVGQTTYLTLTYRENPTQTGLTIRVQGSNDLVTWTTDTDPNDQPATPPTGPTTDPTTGDPLLQVRVPVSATKQFIRLQIQQ